LFPNPPCIGVPYCLSSPAPFVLRVLFIVFAFLYRILCVFRFISLRHRTTRRPLAGRLHSHRSRSFFFSSSLLHVHLTFPPLPISPWIHRVSQFSSHFPHPPCFIPFPNTRIEKVQIRSSPLLTTNSNCLLAFYSSPPPYHPPPFNLFRQDIPRVSS